MTQITEPVLIFSVVPSFKLNWSHPIFAEPLKQSTLMEIRRNGQTGGDPREPGNAEMGKCATDVWLVSADTHNGRHEAPFPVEIPERSLLCGTTQVGDTVLDIYSGTGTTCVAAVRHGRNAIGIDLNTAHEEYARGRIDDEIAMFGMSSPQRKNFLDRARKTKKKAPSDE